MHQERDLIIWISWITGGICGVIILLVVICYCHLMPRQQKSFDEQYLRETYTIKENHACSQDTYSRIPKQNEVQIQRHSRPASYAGDVERRQRDHQIASKQYKPPQTLHASSTMLDEMDVASCADALKTRSLPAFLRPKPRPLSTEDDLQQLYAKVNLSKKYKNRMRNEHAAIIALSKSRSQCLDAEAVIVYDQRTAL